MTSIVIRWGKGIAHGCLLDESEYAREILNFDEGGEDVLVSQEAPNWAHLAIVSTNVTVTYRVRKNREHHVPDAHDHHIRKGEDTYPIHVEPGWEVAFRLA